MNFSLPCEAHPDRPWGESAKVCTCGEPGMPCEACSPAGGVDEPPAVPRGKYIGKRADPPAKDESEHFLRCPQCGGLIDTRDLGQVQEHEVRCLI